MPNFLCRNYCLFTKIDVYLSRNTLSYEEMNFSYEEMFKIKVHKSSFE